MTRAWSRSSFPRPYIWRLTSLSLQICPSVCPFDHLDEIAALTAALSFVTAFANAATRLALARSIRGSSSARAFLRIMPWKFATISRASTRSSTPLSIAATVTNTGGGGRIKAVGSSPIPVAQSSPQASSPRSARYWQTFDQIPPECDGHRCSLLIGQAYYICHLQTLLRARGVPRRSLAAAGERLTRGRDRVVAGGARLMHQGSHNEEHAAI